MFFRSFWHAPRLGRSLVVLVLMVSLLLGCSGVMLWLRMSRIASFAKDTRDEQLPIFLAQQRLSNNIERLRFYGAVILHAEDAGERRSARLAAQILANDAAFERDPDTADKILRTFSNMRLIESLRLKEEKDLLAEHSQLTDGDDIKILWQETSDILRELSDNISSRAVSQAARFSTMIIEETDAARTTAFIAFGLTLVILFVLLLLFYKAVAKPLLAIANGLQKVYGTREVVRLPPTRLNELQTITQGVEQLSRLMNELHCANTDLEILSKIDGLTGIGNRRQFDSHLENEILRARRRKTTTAVMMIDIDHFKSFNDTYGHQQGDHCLQQVARTISLLFRRPGDVVARYGGEEFGVILPETSLAGALASAKRIRDAITGLQIEHAAAESGKLSVSVGVTAFVPHAKSLPEGYVSLADMALYEAKRSGRNCVHTKLPKDI